MMKRNIVIYLYIIGVGLTLSACVSEEYVAEIPQQITNGESISESFTEDRVETEDNIDDYIPTKEEVLAMRELVLEGMSDE